MTDGADLGRRLDACEPLVQRFRALSGAPNVAVAITDAHRTVAVLRTGEDERALQALTAQPVPIGSITKPLAALAVQGVAARRGLALETPAATFLPEFASPAWRGVTLADLLSHRSGLSIGSLASPWSRRDLRAGTALPRFDDLEGRFCYSNLGYEALGRVLEALEDRPFDDLLAREVLRPLGMDSAIGRLRDDHRHAVPPGHAPTDAHSLHWVGEPLQPAAWEPHLGAAGGCAAPLEELAQMLRTLLRAAEGVSGPLAAAWRSALVPQVPCEPGVGYGLGLFRDRSAGRDRAFHAGGVVGHRTLAMTDLAHGFGVVVLTDLGGPLRGSLILRLGHAVLDTVGGLSCDTVGYPLPDDGAVEGGFHATDAAEVLRFEFGHGGGIVHLPDGAAGPLQWTEAHRCMTDRPGWREYEFRLERDPAGRVARVLHGSRTFDRSAAAGTPPARPSGIAGLYRSRNPWAPRVRVTEGALGPMVHVAPLEGRLLPLDGGRMRVAGTPEVITFGPADGGPPLELDLSGAFYARDAG